jgi:hypothetical protein
VELAVTVESILSDVFEFLQMRPPAVGFVCWGRDGKSEGFPVAMVMGASEATGLLSSVTGGT